MIPIIQQGFEKLSSYGRQTISMLLGFPKFSSIKSLPKVDKTGIKRAKSISSTDNESHSVRRAIERSKVPKKIIKEVGKSTEPMYAGGNTASNMRGVQRSQEKRLNEIVKKKYGRTAQGYRPNPVPRKKARISI